ncbi:DUF1772 domain-containing protein [Streptosporangium sp. KLBMP 9127]|nr:DUF1772 domain-containing protein [Streptosporangium sp. KLBMP 9127]
MAVFLPAALLLNGVVAGMLLWSVIGGVPWMRRLSAPEYVRLHQFWSPRFDPLGPICVIGAVLADIALLLSGTTASARVPLLVGLAALVATMAVSLTRSAPLKRSILGLDPARLPADWERLDPRNVWERWNLARSVLANTAFVANTVAVGVLLW